MSKRVITSLLGIGLLTASLLCLSSCGDDNGIDPQILCEQMNSFIADIKENGEFEAIKDKWYNTDETTEPLDFGSLPANNGTIKTAVWAGGQPFSYVGTGGFYGIDNDIIYRFASEYGYGVSPTGFTQPSSLIVGVAQGKFDIGAGSISITQERCSSVCFSDSYYNNGVGFFCLTENAMLYRCSEDVRGLTLAAVDGTANIVDCENETGVTPLVFNSTADMIAGVRRGDVVGGILDIATLGFALKDYPEFTITYTVRDDYVGFMFKKFGYQTLKELEGKKIGCLSGSVFDSMATEKVSGCHISRFDDYSGSIMGLMGGKVDAIAIDEMTAKDPLDAYDSLYLLKEPIGEYDSGMAFPKTAEGDTLRQSFNLFLSDYVSQGKLTALQDKWLYDFEEGVTDDVIDYESLEPTNGSITVYVDPGSSPFTYQKGDAYTGYEVELAYEFCKFAGLAISFKGTNWSALISSLDGKADMVCACIGITEDRLQNIYFSSPTWHSKVCLMVNSKSGSTSDFFSDIGESFVKTFVTEQRWRLFVDGIGTTLFIAVTSILLGIILGFVLFLLCKDGGKIRNLLVKIYNSVLHGLPTVVILLVFYYVIFGKSQLSGLIVSIICFTLTFSTSMLGMLESGVGAIDPGQYEACYALGYSRGKTFFKVILPQAARHFLPNLEGEIVSHLKETAVVGYIAVSDLTKIGDIVRSRTYDAFFPLIASALIYFALAHILTMFVKAILPLIDPKKRKVSRILKGVRIHD